MPSISLDRKSFEKYVGKKFDNEKLKDRISYLGTDLDSVDDNHINVEVFPNRPDMLSVQGFARAFSSFVGLKPGLRKYQVSDSGESVIVDKSVAKIRPYTACAIVKGMKFDDETIKEVVDIQEKLHITYGRHRKKAAIGVYPLEKIRFPIRFLARNPKDIRFQPLEFPHVLDGFQILCDHPAGREYAHLLDGLDSFPIFVDANDNILSMPPIINSHVTGKITHLTKDVFIECSGFDFDVLHKCLNMIVTALSDMGGKVYSLKLKYPDKTRITPDLSPGKMKIDLDYVNKRLGLRLNRKELNSLLARMGFGLKDKFVLIPAYRADILHQIDFVEDIAIAYGFENFQALIPNAATVASEDPFEVFKSKLSMLLVGLGLLEVNTYNLTNIEFQTTRMQHKTDVIHLANSLSAEYNVLRSWLIPSLVEVLANNKHHDYPQKIFGFGTIFKKNESFETSVEETDRLSVILCSDSSDFTSIRQVLDYLMRSIGLQISVEEADHDSFIQGRVGNVMLKHRKVGFLGELHPAVLRNWNLDMPVTCLEISLDALYSVLAK
ncbi:MAG: phenylalanine--tRNA ligase subunit beta [Candidatus Woesearchaeota archaeon]